MWKQVLSGLFEPAARLIDDLHTSEEERATLKNAMQGLLNEVTMGQMALESEKLKLEAKALDARAQVIGTEAKSDSWITRSWRPITMLTFLALIVAHAFGWVSLTEAMAADFMALVQIGLGGYVIGRSAEKAVPGIVAALKRTTNDS